MELLVGIGGNDYTLKTSGGIEAPSISLNTDNSFLAGSASFTARGGALTDSACSGNNCTARLSGFLAGPAASHAGITYTFPTTANGAVNINGVAAFTKGP